MGGRPVSVRLSVNNPYTFRHQKSYGVYIGSVDTLGDPYLAYQELGHCDLFYGT